MQKFMKAIAAIMLTVAVVCAAGCTKPDDPNDPNNGENGGNNGGGNGSGNGETPTLSTEGIYLGIIGFNQHLYEKEISLLNASTKSSFISHIDGLQMKDGTGLYWADNTALKKLQSFGEPPKLTNVALVTFTDGLDNVSLDDNETNPDNYPTKEAYLEGLCNKIRQGVVHDKDITAYTIGLRGNDVSDLDEFHANLKKLASKDSNAYEVSDMNQALQKFTEIAESLHSVTMTASLTLLIPPGYNDGQICRFTFDNISSSSPAAENSISYIECTYKRTENGRRLENITYHGWQTGASSVSSFEKVDRYYKVAFENLMKENGDLVSNDDKRYLQLFYKTSSGEWQKDSEFKPDTFSDVIEEQSSAMIMLILDCTTSLGSEFSSLKDAAKRFVETLVSSNNGGGGGGGNTQFYDIAVSANPSNGGMVTGNGSYQQGQSCTVKATANSGYTFNKWTENGNQVSTNANYTFTVTDNRNLVANFTSNSIGGHDYVDLGLPSGLLWATCNVGANMPEEYGNYYSWGETSTKTTYNWNTYKYCNGSYNKLTKYCNDSNYGNNGFTDNLTFLQSSDDAATVNWANGWRMPTREECEELFNNSACVWTTQNGVNGWRFTASNGNSLFLPAAGICDIYSGLLYVGSSTCYWSSSLMNTYMDEVYSPFWACILTFDLEWEICWLGISERASGLPVRPVRSTK